jgi:hypothetical protein
LIALLTIGTNIFTDTVAQVAIGVDRRPEEAALLGDLGRDQGTVRPWYRRVALAGPARAGRRPGRSACELGGCASGPCRVLHRADRWRLEPVGPG